MCNSIVSNKHAFSGKQVFNFTDLRDIFSGENSWLVTDISLGHYQPLGFVHELSPQNEALKIFERTHISRSLDIDTFIEKEWGGTPSVLVAEKVAQLISQILCEEGKYLAIISPRFGLPWGELNELILYFISQRHQDALERILIISCDDSQYSGTTPSSYFSVAWQDHDNKPLEKVTHFYQDLDLFHTPGLITGDALEIKAQSYFQTSEQTYLYNPFARQNPRAYKNNISYDLDTPEVRRNIYFYLGFMEVRDLPIDKLLKQAWFYLSNSVEKSYISLICKHISDRLSPTDIDFPYNSIQIQRLLILIRDFSHDIPYITDINSLNTAIKAHYAYATGAYLSLKKSSHEAESFFQNEDLFKTDLSPIRYCYYLNIKAYNMLKLGHISDAFALEHEMTERLSHCDVFSRSLSYINFLNLSRLSEAEEKSKDALLYFRKASEYYQDQETDFQYMARLWREAKLLENDGKNHEANLKRYYAAQRFTSLTTPEAFPERLAIAFIGYEPAENKVELVKRLKARFHQEMEKMCIILAIEEVSLKNKSLNKIINLLDCKINSYLTPYNNDGFAKFDAFLSPEEMDFTADFCRKYIEKSIEGHDKDITKNLGILWTRFDDDSYSTFKKTHMYERVNLISKTLLNADTDIDIRLSIFHKYPGSHTTVPWHQDVAYHNGKSKKYKGFSIWVPMDDANTDNGCLHFIPKSHKSKALTHLPSKADPTGFTIEAQNVETRHAVALPIPRGGASLHDLGTLHYSGENKTNIARTALVFRVLQEVSNPQDQQENDNIYKYADRARPLSNAAVVMEYCEDSKKKRAVT